MGENIQLSADDGHEFGAYRVDPQGRSRGGIVVCQEIFGVNAHIRDVCQGFAREGYTAIAPALYDRSSRRDCQLGYGPDDITLGRQLREEFDWSDTVRDVAAVVAVFTAENLGSVTVGYCWGGTISFLAASQLSIAGAVVYYGGQILPYVETRLNCPVLMHFGRDDTSIPLSDVEIIQASHPEATIHLYDAGHGFNCDLRASFDKPSADLARQRTLNFFEEVLN